MKVSKLIHPEIVLGQRGDNGLVNFYGSLLNSIGYSDEKKSFWIAPEQAAISQSGHRAQIPIWRHLDVNTQEHLLLCWKFRDEWRKRPKAEKPGVYYVPAPFTEAISQIDREVPVDLLPKRFFGYIAFGDGAIRDENEEVQGAYVFIGPDHETVLQEEHRTGEPVVWISYVCKDRVPDRTHTTPMIVQSPRGPIVGNFMSVSKVLMRLEPGKISDMLERVPVQDFVTPRGDRYAGWTEERSRVFRTLINLVLYIHSVDADLVPAPTTTHLSHRQKSARRESGQPVNECTVAMSLVSFNYERPRQYHVDATWVETHMRFQRCGPGFKQVKLVWVKGHQRHFDRGTETPPEGTPNTPQ